MAAARAEADVSSPHGGRHSKPPEVCNNPLKIFVESQTKQARKKKKERETRWGGREINNSRFHYLLMVRTPWNSEFEDVALK